MERTESQVTLSEDLPVGSEGLTAGEVTHSGEVDLEKLPTRKERLGYGPQPGVSPFLKEADFWAQYVLCPVCNSQMTLLKGRKGRYGDSLTYQCHNETRPGRYCLVVMSLTVGTKHLMRPGDFEACDVSWEDIANETVEIREGDVVKQASHSDGTPLPKSAPPPPWKRQVVGRVVWDVFWEMALENEGVVEVDSLRTESLKRRPDDTTEKARNRLNQFIYDLPTFMTKSTGFLVRQTGGELRVVSKVQGDPSMSPYSDINYRKQNGME